MDVLAYLCCLGIPVVLIIIVVVQVTSNSNKAKEEEKKKIAEEQQRLSEEKQRKIAVAKTNIANQNKNIRDRINVFFRSEFSSYGATRNALQECISSMKNSNETLKEISPNDDYSSEISECSALVSRFDEYGKVISRQRCSNGTRMIDVENYGCINQAYFQCVQSMQKSNGEMYIDMCEKAISSNDYARIFTIDIETVLIYVWVFAIAKPYSASSFKKAVSVYNRVAEKYNIEVYIAELYAMNQVGGEDVIRESVQDCLKLQVIKENLTILASALMWMKAYKVESVVLQHMLSLKLQMNEKTQERLHSLSNGGGKAPGGFDVSSSGDLLYFDASSLAWKEDEYIGLFENLAFQEKNLSYSLAIRDENKDLYITQGVNVPESYVILKKMNEVFKEEYGDIVVGNMKNCVALSGSGEEKMQCLLVESKECKHVGILVHIARIGKKLNIKFYTLFMPSFSKPEDQKQQVLSLFQKISPSVSMWENSMKDTTLLAIQQLLNATSQESLETNSDADDETPVF